MWRRNMEVEWSGVEWSGLPSTSKSVGWRRKPQKNQVRIEIPISFSSAKVAPPSPHQTTEPPILLSPIGFHNAQETIPER